VEATDIRMSEQSRPGGKEECPGWGLGTTRCQVLGFLRRPCHYGNGRWDGKCHLLSKVLMTEYIPFLVSFQLSKDLDKR
jgi:hypothetical protein